MKTDLIGRVRAHAAGRFGLQLGGAVAGAAVVLAYGEALAGGVRDAWTGAVLPAFLELGASGLPLCG